MHRRVALRSSIARVAFHRDAHGCLPSGERARYESVSASCAMVGWALSIGLIDLPFSHWTHFTFKHRRVARPGSVDSALRVRALSALPPVHNSGCGLPRCPAAPAPAPVLHRRRRSTPQEPPLCAHSSTGPAVLCRCRRRCRAGRAGRADAQSCGRVLAGPRPALLPCVSELSGLASPIPRRGSSCRAVKQLAPASVADAAASDRAGRRLQAQGLGCRD
jgi:hypothetical protein